MSGALLFALLSLASPAYACKPAAVSACEEKDQTPLHVASFEALSGKVEAFQKELTALLANARPGRRRSSCFNSNFAVFFLGQAREGATQRQGKICAEHIKRIKQSTENLVNADSPEWKAVKRKEDQAALIIQAKEVRAALEEFLHRH